LNSSREVFGHGQRRGAGLTGQIRRRRSPAARVEGCGRFTRPVRTCRCPGLRLGWPVVAARRGQAGRRAEENGGGGAPVSSGRGGGVGELREVKAKLKEGSAWAERLRRGGFTAASSSPAFGRSGGGVRTEWRRRSGVWGWGNGERTRGMGRGRSCSADACKR